MVTLQAFTRGNSFYLGKISLGKFTSGFIFPRLKGHTGDHWTLGGLTSQRIKSQILAQKWKTCSRIKRIKEFFILISFRFITFFQRARRARVILLQRLISRRIQRRRKAAFSQFWAIFAWRQQQLPKRVAWVLPRPQYWFETLFHSNALNMWWKEKFRVSRETFNFICATVGPVIQRQDTICRFDLFLKRNLFSIRYKFIRTN